MKKKWNSILLIFSITVLSACDFNVTSDLYTSDLRDVVANENANLMALATLEIEVISDEECKENATQIANLLKEFISKVSSRGCLRKDFDNYLALDTEIPIVNGFNSWNQVNSLLGIIVVESNVGIDVFFATDLDKFEVLNKRVSDEFDQSLNIAKSDVKLNLHSDKQTEIVAVSSAFVDRKPIDWHTEFELSRRGKMEIQLSNVGSAHIERAGYAYAFMLKN